MNQKTTKSFISATWRVAVSAALIWQAMPAYSASVFTDGGSVWNPPPPPHHLPTPPMPTPPPPPPSYTPPTPTFTPPMVQTPIMPLNPKDVTDINFTDPSGVESGDALNGLMNLSENSFPKGSDNDYLQVRGDSDTVFHKESPYSVTLESGKILASLRHPARAGFVNCQAMTVGLSGDADVLVTRTADSVRLLNISGRGQAVKVKLDPAVVGDAHGNVIALAPGYEFVVCRHKINRSDIRIADGFARRHFKVLENGQAAICEVSVESVLGGSPIVARMAQDNNDKERRILNDMSKMAAVLNYVNGTQGFEHESTQMAHR
jgi:hypothetical protein